MRALIVLFLPATLMAQFSGLIATDEGLYFTSYLNLSANPPPRWSNAFHYAAGKGFEWFAPAWGPIRGQLSDASADGLVFATLDVQRRVDCSNMPDCDIGRSQSQPAPIFVPE